MDVIQAYRDDGPLAELLGPVVARLPVAPLPAITAGAAALVVGVALDGTTTGWPTVLGASLLGVFAPVAVVLAVWCALLFVTDSVGQWLRAASAVAVEQDAAEDDED